MTRERGSGVTPNRVVQQLQKAVDEKSILAVHKATGIGQAAIARYLSGKGEPTTATLEKLAAYFKVSVPFLRGEEEETIFSSDRVLGCLLSIAQKAFELQEKVGPEPGLWEIIGLSGEVAQIINDTYKYDNERTEKLVKTMETLSMYKAAFEALKSNLGAAKEDPSS